jgi:hypothetical protein
MLVIKCGDRYFFSSLNGVVGVLKRGVMEVHTSLLRKLGGTVNRRVRKTLCLQIEVCF